MLPVLSSIIKSGWIVEITHHSTEIDDSQYEQMTVLAARSAESGKLIKTTGVVYVFSPNIVIVLPTLTRLAISAL